MGISTTRLTAGIATCGLSIGVIAGAASHADHVPVPSRQRTVHTAAILGGMSATLGVIGVLKGVQDGAAPKAALKLGAGIGGLAVAMSGLALVGSVATRSILGD